MEPAGESSLEPRVLIRVAGGQGAEPEEEEAKDEEAETELPPGAQAFGRAVFFPDERKVVLEGRVCLDAPKAALEYFACFEQGKEYESVIAVKANAAHVNLAMIALKYSSGGGVEVVGDPRVPRGDPVIIHAEWKNADGETVRARAEDLIWNSMTKKTMKRTAWLYTGSRMVRDEETRRFVYMAAIDGVMAACYRDPHAIFNTPLDTGTDDTYYFINRELCPPKGTPVRVIITPGEPGDVELHDLPEEE